MRRRVRVGLEPDNAKAMPTNDLGNTAGPSAAKSGAVQYRKDSHDAELAQVVAAWSALPEAVRRQILSMVTGVV